MQEFDLNREKQPVFLAHCLDYSQKNLLPKISQLLESALPYPIKQSTVLLKPNFISRQNSRLSCTRPEIIRAVAKFFLESRNKVLVGDSPAFGRASLIAEELKLKSVLKDLPVKIVNFRQKSHVHCPGWGRLPLAAEAVNSEHLINLPKLKAHKQLALSGAVKNLFGCVTGLRKAWLHARFGDRENMFEKMLLSLVPALPHKLSLLDGIQAMHCSGPTKGKPISLELIAASQNPLALDTGICTLLGLTPNEVPLWKESRRAELPGAFEQELSFPWLDPQSFAGSKFKMPKTLSPVSFNPARLILSTLKRFWLQFK